MLGSAPGSESGNRLLDARASSCAACARVAPASSGSPCACPASLSFAGWLGGRRLRLGLRRRAPRGLQRLHRRARRLRAPARPGGVAASAGLGLARPRDLPALGLVGLGVLPAWVSRPERGLERIAEGLAAALGCASARRWSALGLAGELGEDARTDRGKAPPRYTSASIPRPCCRPCCRPCLALAAASGCLSPAPLRASPSPARCRPLAAGFLSVRRMRIEVGGDLRQRLLVRGVDQPHDEEERHHRRHEVGVGDLPHAALVLALFARSTGGG